MQESFNKYLNDKNVLSKELQAKIVGGGDTSKIGGGLLGGLVGA
jgi:hypothetical protein